MEETKLRSMFVRKIISYIKSCVQPIIYMAKSKQLHHLCTVTESKSYWVDIPLDILAIIIYKLSLPDRIRLLCVCKSWRLSKDYVINICSAKLPWLVPLSNRLWVHASKDGWLILREGIFPHLYNPLTKESIILPQLPQDHMAITFTTKPTSPDCEVLALGVVASTFPRVLFIIRYRVVYRRNKRIWNILFDKEETWNNAQILESSYGDKLINLHYMKGKLFCLFSRGVVKTYNLADRSWELLTSEIPEPHLSCRWSNCFWLNEHEEDLIMLHRDHEDDISKWTIFKIDWSKMCWTIEENLTGISFFISGKILLLTPLRYDNGNIVDDCWVSFIDDRKCYSLKKENGKEIQGHWIKSSERRRLTLMEVPKFSN